MNSDRSHSNDDFNGTMYNVQIFCLQLKSNGTWLQLKNNPVYEVSIVT
jgi:hypothetical protein